MAEANAGHDASDDRQAAESGNIAAMVRLAFELYKKGRHTESENWYRRAANLGDTNAMFMLAQL